MEIGANLEKVREGIARACLRAGRSPSEVTLVAVTKGVTPKEIEAAFAAGVRHFGENRVQEAAEKIPRLSSLPIVWHMVGHLQSNKVNVVLRLFDIIQSVDSVKLGQALSQRAQGLLPILLEVNLSGEASKFGFPPEELPAALSTIAPLPNLEVRGLMAVAPISPDPERLRPLFRRLRETGDALGLKELSMGMSDDFEVAVEEGATMVRIGRAIFGYERRQV